MPMYNPDRVQTMIDMPVVSATNTTISPLVSQSAVSGLYESFDVINDRLKNLERDMFLMKIKEI